MRERVPDASAGPDPPARRGAEPESAAGRVLALQRSHGNQAVVRWLARKTPAELFAENVAGKQWGQALTNLENVDKKGVGGALGALSPDELRYLDDAATRHKSATPIRLRTGIGKALDKRAPKFGKASAKYGKTKSGKKSDPRYEIPIELTFKPDPAAVAADEISWIQTVRVTDMATGALNEDRPEFSSRATSSGWMLDRMENRKLGWYGFDNTGGTATNVRPWKRATPNQPAWMYDGPEDDVENTTWEFEAAAVCMTGSADTPARKGDKPGFVYAVVTWGFDAGRHGRIKKHPIKVWHKPSTSFLGAVDQWNAQARDELAVMNDADQEELPAIQ